MNGVVVRRDASSRAAARSALLLASALVSGVAAPARAAIDCLSLPSPIFVTGSTAAKPLLAPLARYLAAADHPASVVYQGQGSCAGVDAILNGTPLKGESSTAATSWDRDGNELTCSFSASGPAVVADVGLSDVFASTCVALPGGLPSNVADFLGPVQTMTFVVPVSSSERSISAEAAYNVFGFGADSGVAPWTDPSMIFRRDAASGTQRMIAAALGVPAERWAGTMAASSSALVKALADPGVNSAAIGILAADVAQDNRATLSVLAFQHFEQTCGYYPDRAPTSNEKSNVRDGHYVLWGPLHVLARVSASGLPLNPAAGDLIGYLTGTKAAPDGLDLIALEAAHHVVPRCAMRVSRTQEMGALSSFAPAGACGCAYEKAANGRTSCVPCTTSRDCPGEAPVCSYQYCETQ